MLSRAYWWTLSTMRSLMGVGTPLLYGVTLPLGRPFVTACLGGGFGGAFIIL